jgi:hypothetical protein
MHRQSVARPSVVCEICFVKLPPALTTQRLMISISIPPRKEVLMRKALKRRQGSQFDLFPVRPRIPGWPTLPAETRRKAEGLLARMLQEHRRKRLEADKDEGASDE